MPADQRRNVRGIAFGSQLDHLVVRFDGFALSLPASAESIP